ncbi:hypothetical protein Tco_0062861 [Tanacetum coccineum]
MNSWRFVIAGLGQSRFLRYIDTSPNGDALRKCILEGPYKLTTVTIPVVPTTDDSPEVPERTTVETLLNMSPENRAHYESEKEAINLLLTGIRDEIYSIVDACKTAHDMWIAIEDYNRENLLTFKSAFLIIFIERFLVYQLLVSVSWATQEFAEENIFE